MPNPLFGKSLDAANWMLSQGYAGESHAREVVSWLNDNRVSTAYELTTERRYSIHGCMVTFPRILCIDL